MNKAKHTPGPWKACKQFPHQSFIEIEHGDKHTPGAASLVIAKVTCRPTWKEEQEANARLIAAAPDLLNALEAVLNEFAKDGHGGEFEDGEHPYVDAARAAIAKATGQT